MRSTEPEPTQPDSGTDEGPAVTTEALSADPVPPVDNEDPRIRRDPVADPSGAARELPESSGGPRAEPDLTEVDPRAAPGIAAARFEVDVEPDRTADDQEDRRDRPS